MFCLLSLPVGLYLVLRIWTKHGEDHLRKKIVWSMIVLVPVIGWIFYGGFYRPLSSRDQP